MNARLALTSALFLAAGTAANAQVGNGFTYQGRLTDNGQPATGVYDLHFSLYNGPTALFPIGNPVDLQDVQVTAGLFTVRLDFGGQFDGNAKWVGISVRPGAATGAYTVLSPRQELTPAPYAISTASLNLPMSDSGFSDAGLFNEALFRIEQTGTAHAIMGVAGNGGSGVHGQGTGTSPGVSGVQAATSGFVSGVYGESASPSGRGVYGHAVATGGSAAYGVYGVSESNTSGATGVRGVNSGGGSVLTYGVFGQSTSSGGAGVHGQSKTGVYGLSTSGGEEAAGVLGITSQTDGSGVVGRANSGSASAGVWAQAGPGWAAYLSGNVYVTGTLAGNDKQFLIDNPENPANEYLTHGCVESDEYKNIYDGLVTLDQFGTATVALPSWFDNLNGDFRYQLTCIGGHAPVYIAREIQNNAFLIAGGTPGLRVSWQVTGVRIDPAGVAARFQVVRAKPASERGRFLNPTAWGLDDSVGISRMANPTPNPALQVRPIEEPAASVAAGAAR